MSAQWSAPHPSRACDHSGKPPVWHPNPPHLRIFLIGLDLQQLTPAYEPQLVAIPSQLCLSEHL
jgi:hypothetical protein